MPASQAWTERVGVVSFLGAIRSVLPLAPAEHRAGVLSVIYVVLYLALTLTAIIAGVVVVGTGRLELTARAFGIAVIALAFAGLARRGQVETASATAAGVWRIRLPRAARAWAEAAAIHCLILVS